MKKSKARKSESNRKKTRRRKIRRQRTFPLRIKFDYDIRATTESEAKEIALRTFLVDVHAMASNVQTVEDFVLHRNKLAYREGGEERGTRDDAPI